MRLNGRLQLRLRREKLFACDVVLVHRLRQLLGVKVYQAVNFRLKAVRARL